MSKFYDLIKEAKIERQVEDVYNKGFETYFQNAPITYPYACDGVIDTHTANKKKLKLLMEFKYDEDLNSKVSRAKVIIQTVFYIKRFELKGEQLPNIIFIGDINECFVLHTNNIIKYLDEDIDWNVSPSTAYQKYPDLVLKIAEDDDINFNIYIFDVDEHFKFKEVATKITDIADNIHRFIHITEHNIEPIFQSFCKKVIKSPKKIPTNDLVALFIGTIADSDNYYKHPTKKNTLVTPIDTISINGEAFDGFFRYFARDYSPQEKHKFAEISDRLIEDTNRRNKGEFYTPTIWVDYAHKMIAEQLGENWRTEFTVWDCCCGTKNLTRDYYFGDLYCSTLENAELRIGSKYNKEAISFQYDFLNDDLDKLPEGLLKAFEQNKPIVFFINPPYATACNQGDTSKEGINKTIIREQMIASDLGSGAENLQHQFMYRICELKNKFNLTTVHIALFSKPIYLTGEKQQKFLQFYCDNFKFNSGIIFQASNFANVSTNWGITFNIWSNGVTDDVHNFAHTILEDVDGNIESFGVKNLYNAWDNILASKWVRQEIKGLKTEDLPNLTNAINIKQENTRGKGIPGELGYMHNNANSIQYNQLYVGLYSSPCAAANGLPILNSNLKKCCSLFSARKLITGDWINDKDEYLAPNEQHPLFEEFTNDSIIYSLFHSSSNQSSLRQIEYKEKLWNIKNEFFFLPKDKILELANEFNNDDCYNDARVSEDRYVANLLFKTGLYDKLSIEAKAVLDKAIELTEKSFKYRKLFDEEHPEYQINNWDCGWYQIKAVLKEYMPEEYKEFQELFKELGNKMRPMVYELGFLK